MDRAAQWAHTGSFPGRAASSSANATNPSSDEGTRSSLQRDSNSGQDRQVASHPQRMQRLQDSSKSEQGLSQSRIHGQERNMGQASISSNNFAAQSTRQHVNDPVAAHPYHHRHKDSSVSDRQPMLHSDFSSADPSSVELGPYPSSTIRIHKKRMATNLGDLGGAPIEVRHTNKYVLRRPRPLMIEHGGHVLAVGAGEKIDVQHPENNYHLDIADRPKSHEHHPNSLHKQRERLDIFVDLIWVGIIANIAEHFHTEIFSDEISAGDAFGEFLLLFLPAWRMWSMLQQFLNSFYTDDYLQRLFVSWIMILGLLWGNNAPYLLSGAYDGTDRDNWTIITYLVAMASFSIITIIYSHWLPWLRRYILLSTLASAPSIGLWTGATCIPAGDTKWTLVSLAVSLNVLETFFLSTPLADRLLGNGIRKAQDSRTLIRRYENFFIIALGEGVFLLIRDSPLVDPAHGYLSIHLGRGIISLSVFYALNWIYFHADMSKRYVHAMDRRWWVKFLWHTLHIPLFAALVILSSGTQFLVTFPEPGESADYTASTTSKSDSGAEPPSSTEPAHKLLHLFTRVSEGASEAQTYSPSTLHSATIITFVSIAVIFACMLGLALLNRPMDGAQELKVGNRFVRMGPRAAGIVVMAVLWTAPFEDATVVLGVVLAVVGAVATAEQVLGSEREAGLVEPREEGVRVDRK